jgi:TrmH family RNA methyltransferase
LTRRHHIASPANPRLKAVRRLARGRSRELVLADGFRALDCALAGGALVREVYLAPELSLGSGEEQLVAAAEERGACVVEVDAAAFRTVAAGVRPDGVLAVVDRPRRDLERLPLPSEPLVVVAVGIERPGNLGTIVRTACAAGADALVVADPCVDAFHREVVRGSVGTVFRLPVLTARGERAVASLRDRRLRIVATSPGAVRPYWQAGYAGGVAIVLGCERHGLPRTWLAAADEVVSIPLPGPADSLNVAVAAGVVLCEAARQRVGQAEKRAAAATTAARIASLPVWPASSTTTSSDPGHAR